MLYLIFSLLMTGYVFEDSDSLLVMGNDSVFLNDYRQYNLRIHVLNGGKIKVRPWNGFDTTGRLILIAPRIDIGSGGSIVASGAGYWGGVNNHPSGYGTGFGNAGGLSGGGGGAGAYGGEGGDGGDNYPGAGGSAYGSISDTIVEMGSGGGCGRLGAVDGLGGNGGGSICLAAREATLDSGQVLSRGDPGYDGSLEAGGAGAGGGIMIKADTVRISHSTLNCGAGNGGGAGFGGGGGGGGGRIKVFYSAFLDTSSISVGCPFGLGGAGDISNGTNGGIGTVYIGPPVAVDERTASRTADWNISPNPSRGFFAIDNPGDESREIAVFDVQGRVVWTGSAAPGQNRIRLSGLPAGVYTALIQGGSGRARMIVVR